MSDSFAAGGVIGELGDARVSLGPTECVIAPRDGVLVCVRGEHPGCDWQPINQAAIKGNLELLNALPPADYLSVMGHGAPYAPGGE